MSADFFIQDYMFGDHNLPEKRLEAHQVLHGGVIHRSQADPFKPKPGEPIMLTVNVGGDQPYDLVRAFYTLDDSAPDPKTAHSLDFHLAETSWDTVGWQYVQRWQAALPAQINGTMIRYQVAARRTSTDNWIFADNQAADSSQATNFALWVSDIPQAAWTAHAQIYHVFLDRFNPGGGNTWKQTSNLNGFFGGTLRGVSEKLDYIQSLGYNAIWLSPFFVSSSHHGYDAEDMYQVEPRYGTNEDLYALIEALHARGMRVILDFVANHWSDRHFSMQAAKADRSSEYYDWYLWKEWPQRYEGFFDLLDMPKLNLGLGMPARKYLLDCAKFWLEKGFDGYRLDFAYGPPLDFWVDFRRTCKTTKPDCWLFGEVILAAPDQRMFAVAFDGQIDFLLADALRQTFGFGRWSLEKFDAFLGRHETFFDQALGRLTILDNHDMNRFLFLAGNDPARLKLGALVMYTLAGSPINYYGTEAGVTQAMPIHHDDKGFFEEARAPMLWDEAQNADLRQFFCKLTALRAQHAEFITGIRRTVHLDSQQGTYGYLRSGPSGSAVVLLNTSLHEHHLSLSVPGWQAAADLLSGLAVGCEDGLLEVVLKPQSGLVLTGL